MPQPPTPWQAIATAVAALACALCPRQCHGCSATLAGLGTHGLCATCVLGLAANGGPRCRRCDLPQCSRNCRQCPAVVAHIAHIRAPLLYAGIVPTLVQAGKFNGNDAVWASLAQHVAADAAARQLLLPNTTLVPVPLGCRRARVRGYNQSSLLAQALARSWRLPVAYGLRRRGNAPAQSGLGLEARRRNLRNAFVCDQSLPGPVLLVDDVVTSGATLVAAAAAVAEAGATSVSAVAVARTAALPDAWP